MEGKKCDVIPYYQRYKNTCWKAVAKTVLQYMGYDVNEYRDTREREEDGPGSAIDLLFTITGSKKDEDIRVLSGYVMTILRKEKLEKKNIVIRFRNKRSMKSVILNQ